MAGRRCISITMHQPRHDRNTYKLPLFSFFGIDFSRKRYKIRPRKAIKWGTLYLAFLRTFHPTEWNWWIKNSPISTFSLQLSLYFMNERQPQHEHLIFDWKWTFSWKWTCWFCLQSNPTSRIHPGESKKHLKSKPMWISRQGSHFASLLLA